MNPVVLFETLWADAADGWAIASRGYARAMDAVGVDVRLHSWMPLLNPIHQQSLEEIGHLLNKPARRGPKKWDAYVFSTTLGGPEKLNPSLQSLLSYERPRSFYTTFERTNIEASSAELLKQLDSVWVPCTQNAKVLHEAGVENTIVIPHCFFDDNALLQLSPIVSVPKVFYWIGRWEPRKAPHNLVKAWLLAFGPEDGVELFLKLSPIPWLDEKYPSFDQVLLRLMEDEQIAKKWKLVDAARCITVLPSRLSLQQMTELHAHGDVYVSASRGEGWDLPAFEAKLAGRRVVTTDSGGPRDFLGPDDILVPATGTVLADPQYDWGEGALYNDYELQALVQALRQAYEEPKSGSREGVQHCHYLQVGTQLKSWIEDLL